MYLTVSKRFEFSASVRPFRAELTESEDQEYYGPGSSAIHGYGNNYTAYFVFHGPIDTRTGMLVDLAVIKPRILDLLARRYDHKFLNADTTPFNRVPPTPENLAIHLLKDASPLFDDLTAHPVACHLEITPETGATAYADRRIERDFWIEFSAARRTNSPHLTEKENAALFGVASSPMGHGHNYRLRATLRGEIEPESGQILGQNKCADAMDRLCLMLDHKNLNDEVPLLTGSPITTEGLARFAWQQLSATLPVTRVKLYETRNFFAEYNSAGEFSLGYELPLHAAHRLHSAVLSDTENQTVYGKCNNPAGHGHRYCVEATISGSLDERSGTLFNLQKLHSGLTHAMAPWQYRHLDIETSDFQDRPSTGENICHALWPQLNDTLEGKLSRLRIWETPNNRFTLRKDMK